MSNVSVIVIGALQDKLSDTIHYLPASSSSKEARNIISTLE
jgi:hypothetical protein